MIDIHAHIIPAVDDGPQSWETSMELLRQGNEDGIARVVATPHIMSNADFDKEEDILAKIDELRERTRAAGLEIEILAGCELYLQPKFNLESILSTLNNNGRYFLMEFPMQFFPEFVEKQFFETIADGKVPIIAHPERYVAVIKNLTRAYDFVRKNALLQVNAGSLLGRFGSIPQKTAVKLMDANLVHFIGSDCHHPEGRPLRLLDAYNLVSEKWGEERARKLFIENPEKALAGEVIDVPPAEPVNEDKKSSFFKRFNLWKFINTRKNL